MKGIHGFVYTISTAGFAAVVLFLPLGEHWWAPATCLAEVVAGLGWGLWAWRQSRPPKPGLDYDRIAELEWEIFGS